MRSGRVDHDLCLECGAVSENDLPHPTAHLVHFADLGSEAELRPVVLGGDHQVVRGECRIADETGIGREVRGDLRTRGIVPEGGIIDGTWWEEPSEIECRKSGVERRCIEGLVGNPDLVEMTLNPGERRCRRIQHEHARPDQPGVAQFVGDTEEVGPPRPQLRGLPRQLDRVERRVVEPDECR